jgi:hypothetical protein
LKLLWVLILIGCFLAWGMSSIAAERSEEGLITVECGTGGQGDKVRLKLVLNDVPNLAGLKVVLGYDADLMEYVGFRKAPVADTLMHMVNPKQKGRVIVVMAGAQGIALDNEPVMEVILQLKELSGQDIPATTKVRILEVEAMADTLEPIHVQTRDGAVTITGGAGKSTKGVDKSCARKKGTSS